MNKNSNVYVSVKTIVEDKLSEAGKSEAFIEAVQLILKVTEIKIEDYN